MGLIHPQRDARAWAAGPEGWKTLMAALHERPVLTRVIAAGQIAGGIWWALSQEKQSRDSS